jgi:hypothetical protein
MDQHQTTTAAAVNGEPHEHEEETRGYVWSPPDAPYGGCIPTLPPFPPDPVPPLSSMVVPVVFGGSVPGRR